MGGEMRTTGSTSSRFWKHQRTKIVTIAAQPTQRSAVISTLKVINIVSSTIVLYHQSPLTMVGNPHIDNE